MGNFSVYFSQFKHSVAPYWKMSWFLYSKFVQSCPRDPEAAPPSRPVPDSPRPGLGGGAGGGLTSVCCVNKALTCP